MGGRCRTVVRCSHGGWRSDHAFHGYGGETARQQAKRLEREERAAVDEHDHGALHKAVWAVGAGPPAAVPTEHFRRGRICGVQPATWVANLA